MRVLVGAFFALATLCLAFLAAVPGGLIVASIPSVSAWGWLVVGASGVVVIVYVAGALYYAVRGRGPPPQERLTSGAGPDYGGGDDLAVAQGTSTLDRTDYPRRVDSAAHPPLRIGLVSPRYPPAIGGVERHVAALATGLTARGVEVEVITCDPGARQPVHEVVDGVVVHRFPTLAGDDVLFVSPALGTWLLSHARRFSLIHAHSYHTPVALEALVAARRARLPFVLTTHYHGTGHTLFRRALHVLYRPYGRLLVRGARQLICVSAAERTLLRRDFGNDLPVTIAPNGVDVDAIRAATPLEREPERRLVLAVGRLEPYKQVDRIVGALARLPEEYVLSVIGSGPAEAGLGACARAIGVDARVRLLGSLPTPELHRWLRTADVLVTLSRHEAFGITLLEAGVAGAGVVASDIPAHREVGEYLDPGRVRYVSPDAPAELIAEAILEGGRHGMPDEDAARVPRWTDTVARTVEAYERAMSYRMSARHGRG